MLHQARQLTRLNRCHQYKRSAATWQRRSLSAPADEEAVCRLHNLVRAYRDRGYLEATLDPLGLYPPTANTVDLNPLTYKFRNDTLLGFKIDGVVNMGVSHHSSTAEFSSILSRLRRVYCDKVGAQFSHVESLREYMWIARQLEMTVDTPLSAEEKLRIYSLVMNAEVFDHFLGRKFASTKRYGLEGCEAMMPTIDAILRFLAESSVTNAVIGMPHRGRLNLLSELLNYPARGIFHKICGNSELSDGIKGSGDVLSHLAITTTLKYGTSAEKEISVSLLHNPSHLEAINPVAQGKTRAKADVENRKAACIMIHGDAACAGQGVTSETLAMSNVPNYRVDGTIHVIVNNQIGYTTLPMHSRSSRYSADIAKGVSAPIFQINADEGIESVVRIAKLAVDYRNRFKKDVWIELIGYRRHGHNELDEPGFTQPIMYSIIRKRPSIVTLYGKKLIEEGVITEEYVKQQRTNANKRLELEFSEMSSYKPIPLAFEGAWKNMTQPDNVHDFDNVDTGVREDILSDIALKSVELPADFNVHPRLQKFHINDRVKSIKEKQPVDWATAEAMAAGSLLLDGYHIRLAGQDVERGTFSQRHWSFWDQQTEAKYVPLIHSLPGSSSKGKLWAVASPLSELGVLGFEYGFNINQPNVLSLWEAQFGDFANGAQVVIDTFLSSGEEKWGRQSSLTMLLPHGFDATGPEHSSSHIERYLQMTDGNINTPEKEQRHYNLGVVNLTTPANYFHVLRRQMLRPFRKPLMIATPKKLLKHDKAVSPLSDMGPGTTFQAVLGDSTIRDPRSVETVVLCSGQMYYALDTERTNRGRSQEMALVRLEELSPFPYKLVDQELARYPNAKSLVWFQEEPENAGAYLYVEPRLRHLVAGGRFGGSIRYVGRKATGSVATGIIKEHEIEYKQIIKSLFG